jgi:sugar transferase EpsL
MLKRVLDIAAAAVGLMLLAPLMAVIASVAWLVIGSPILFRQQRAGLLGKPFLMYKFRTMRDMRDADGNLLPDHVRLTRFGRFLRNSSLDELPELVNVLRGEMSLVGPRPLLMEYLDRYTPAQARRHEILPGLTGLAQVNGRNELSWAEKLRLDVWYVDHRTLRLDLAILWLTFTKVLKCDGISAAGHATMPEFQGSE